MWVKTRTVRGERDPCTITRTEYEERAYHYKALVAKVLKDFPKVIAFDPTSLFCDDVKCYGIKDGVVLYRDADHLSDEGSMYVAKHLAPLIKFLESKR